VKPYILDGKLFAEMVSKTTFATSNSDARPILQGVNMTFNADKNVFVSTDSHRLSRLVFDGTHEESSTEDLPKAITVPASVLDHALKSFDLSMQVAIFPSPQQIAIANGNTILYSRLLEGNYPETERLIPTEFNSQLVVNRKEIIESLELLATLGTNNIVELKVNGLFVELKAQGSNAKGMKEIAFETYDGEEGFSISFSAAYALVALKTTEHQSIKFRFVGAMRPFLITPVEESNELQLILPVRQG
ncbi:MAG: DNA polymerase III subunit beta, partial [Paenisporosarcina sp.]|nr:DNA polymerase III subunit beta [Paenisporosarcina sp.]